MARDALIQLAAEHNDLVPMIWQMSDPQSPGAANRFGLYGGEIFPLGVWDGTLTLAGEEEVYNQYAGFYEELTGQETPWSLDVQFGFNEDNNYLITTDITLEDNVSTGNKVVLFAITWHDGSNYTSVVMNSSFNDTLSISGAGETQHLEQLFVWEDYFDLSLLKAVVVIQDTETREILQSAQTGITQLLPDALVNMNSGPASLGIYFENNSFPRSGLTYWNWDFNSDGVIDSIEENPYWVFDEPGVYDVTLSISDGFSRAVREFPAMITVTEPTAVEGAVTGVWCPEFNPYVIVDDISIPYYGELVIEPGTEILVDYNKKINVYGRIASLGSAEEPVIMTSETSWKGIKLLNTMEDNRLEYTWITNSSLAGVNASYSVLEVSNSRFNNNTSGSLGAAINLLGCEDVLLYNNVIVNNYSSMTGGIAMRSSHPVMYNNIIANNEGSMAGALVIRENSAPILFNNIIANNQAPIAAIFVDESTPEFSSNILLDEEAVFLGSLEQMRLDYNLTSQDLGGNNFVDDPLFIMATTGSGTDYDALTANWQLQENSPAIDAGNPNSDYNDPEDPENPGYALYPALGLVRNDIGAYGGPGTQAMTVPAQEDEIAGVIKPVLTLYPNPFRTGVARAQISFNISSASGGEIKVYNLRGQDVAVLKTEEGSSQFTWDGRNYSGKLVSSGVYLAKWQNGSQSAGQKMILLR
ncbi:MAG: T9SS type A sorting domain-containing protein [Candidatus Cloacimonetes bacterium]|nr:T9SS type A sorting domain-containing protein [Candidatus Cloacimonadota bacterium]